MKLITAIVNKEDSRHVNKELNKAGFTVTRLSTTGGFLLASNVTLLIGTGDDKVDECISIIEEFSRQRKEMVPNTATYPGDIPTTAYPLEVTVGGATIFVTDVVRFEKV